MLYLGEDELGYTHRGRCSAIQGCKLPVSDRAEIRNCWRLTTMTMPLAMSCGRWCFAYNPT